MTRFAYLLIGIAFLLISCVDRPREIVILHTNDIHGRFLAEPAAWREDSAMVGGFAALSGFLSQFREQYSNTLYLDAGDLMTGNPICDIDYNGIEGGALLRFLEMLNLDAFALGNHEFDKGAAFAKRFAEAGSFPMLCANLVLKEENEPAFTPYAILNRGGLRIGIIGLMLDGFDRVVAQNGSEPFVIINTAAVAQEFINKIDEQTDLIILLTHNGLEQDRKLAQTVRNADVIIGGHSHNRLTEPETVNGVIIAQAGSYCKNLGVLKITVAGDSVAEFSGELVALVLSETTPDQQVAAFSDSLETVIDSLYGEIINETRVPLTRNYSASGNLGNLLCDLLRSRFATDIAFVNSGGIRKNLAPGPISKLDIVEMLPFMNSVVVFEATGEELLRTARQQVRAQAVESAEIMQMSGMTIRYRLDKSVATVDDVEINGELLEMDRLYTVAAHDYITESQPDHYLKFTPRNSYHTGQLFSDVIIEEIASSRSPLRADARPRLEKIQ